MRPQKVCAVIFALALAIMSGIVLSASVLWAKPVPETASRETTLLQKTATRRTGFGPIAAEDADASPTVISTLDTNGKTIRNEVKSTVKRNNQEATHETIQITTRSFVDGESVTIETRNGRAEYRGWDRTDIQIESRRTMRLKRGSGFKFLFISVGWGNSMPSPEEATKLFEQMKTDITEEDGALTINAVFPKSQKNVSMSNDLIVHGPRGLDVTLKTDNGAVTVEGISGTVDAQTANGAVDLKDLEGPCHAQTSNGALTVVNASGGLDLSTSNGRIDCNAVSGSIQAQTDNGRISLRIADALGPEDVISCESSNGAIECFVPEAGRYTVQAHAIRGAIDSSVPIKNERWSGAPETRDPADGARIRLKTTNGAIKIKEY